MPTSDHNTIDTVLKIVARINPSRIFEVGAGYGKYAHLLRDMLDVHKGLTWGKFETVIDGCEAFGDYINEVHRALYNTISVGDARDMKIEGYDLVIAVDVIEHLPFDTVAPFVQRLIRDNKFVLIAVPYVVERQGDVFGNHYETHVSQFNYAYFRKFGHYCFFPSDSLVALFSKDPIPDYWRKDRKRTLRRAIQGYFPNLYSIIRDYRHRRRFTVGPLT